MKKMKKIFALAIALVMVLSMSMVAFAAEDDPTEEPAAAAVTVTIDPQTPEGATNTPTYTYYVMMKASVAGEKVSYYVETKTLADAIDGLKVGDDDLFTVKKATGADRWNISINKKADGSEFTGEEVAAALQTIKGSAIATSTASNNKIELDYDAYLLVESSLGTKLVLDTVTTKTIKEKNTYPSVTKTEDKSNAEIGGTVTYTIPVVIPATVAEKPIVVTDIITKGLTLNTAITADNDVTGLTWALESTDATTQAKTYKVTIPAATVKALAGKTLTLTYTATVNELAVVNVAETNKAKLEYDNFTTVETDPVEVKTFGFDLTKIGDGDDNNPLKDVTFTLKNASNEYYTLPTSDTSNDEDRFVALAEGATAPTVATDANGKITFAGLAQGTYTLTEIETNTGYNLLTGDITVTIDDKGEATFSGEGASKLEGNAVKINNQSGTVLPSTGGIGTTIFYIVGAILVIGAGVVLVTRRRMNVQ